MNAPLLAQLLGESCVRTLMAISVHNSRCGKPEAIHPGRAKLSGIRSEVNGGVELHPTTIGRHLGRARAAGILKRIQHGGRYATDDGRVGRAADVYVIEQLFRRAVYGNGDWTDATRVAAVCPPRNVRRYAGVIARRVAASNYAKECAAVKRGTALGDAIHAARAAARGRLVDVTVDDAIEGEIADQLEIIRALDEFDSIAPAAGNVQLGMPDVQSTTTVGRKPTSGPLLRLDEGCVPLAPTVTPKPPPIPADASDNVHPAVRAILARQLANKPPT